MKAHGSSSWPVRRRVGEVVAAGLTGLAAMLSSRLFGLYVYLALPCLVLWLLYAAARVRRDPFVLTDWGLRLDNLRSAAWRTAPFLLVGALGMLFYRLARGWRPLPASSALVFALYPLWGVAQQFLVQGIAAGNLRRLGVPPAAVVAVVAVLFGLVHTPDWPLAALSGPACAVWAALYLRTPNLIPLGLSHGWLGALAYYWVLGRNPLAAIFPPAG